MAETDPPLRERQPWKAAYERDYAWLSAIMTEHYAGDETNVKVLAAGVLAAYDGISVEDFEAQAGDFLRSTQHPTLGRGYLDCAYRPMVELLAYLAANGFSSYIFSGGGRDFMRPISDEVYGIPRQRVIGSTPRSRTPVTTAAARSRTRRRPTTSTTARRSRVQHRQRQEQIAFGHRPDHGPRRRRPGRHHHPGRAGRRLGAPRDRRQAEVRLTTSSASSTSSPRPTSRSRPASTRCGWNSPTTAAGSPRAAPSPSTSTASRPEPAASNTASKMGFSADELCDIGADSGSPASPDYGPRDNAFDGQIAWVRIELGDDDHDHHISAEDRFNLAVGRH